MLSKASSIKNDLCMAVWQSIDNVEIYNYAKFYQNILWGSRVISVSLKELNRSKWCSAKPRYCFAWQWLNNVKVHKYAKFEANISWGSRVMSIFTKRSSTGQSDAWRSLVTRLHGSGWMMSKYISIQNLKWLCYGVQGLWAFHLLIPNFNWCSAKPRPPKKTYAWHSIDNVDMYTYAKFYQNIPCGSRVISVFANWWRTDRQTDRQTNGHTQWF